jgi:hypothetical protein
VLHGGYDAEGLGIEQRNGGGKQAQETTAMYREDEMGETMVQAAGDSSCQLRRQRNVPRGASHHQATPTPSKSFQGWTRQRQGPPACRLCAGLPLVTDLARASDRGRCGDLARRCRMDELSDSERFTEAQESVESAVLVYSYFTTHRTHCILLHAAHL